MSNAPREAAMPAAQSEMSREAHPEARLFDCIELIETRLASGLDRLRLSNESGVPLEDLEQFLRAEDLEQVRYSEPLADAYEALLTWCAEAREQTRPVGLERVAWTPTAKAINAALDSAKEGDKWTITGGVGTGKTFVAQARAESEPKTRDTRGFLYVCLNPTTTSPVALLAAIAAALPGQRGGAHQKGVYFTTVCRGLGRGDVLILDEANFAAASPGETLDVGRDVADRTGCGLVIIGNPVLSRALGREDAYAALASRAFRLDIVCTTEADVDAALYHFGLKGKPLREVAVRIGARPGPRGGLRALFLVLEAARRAAGGGPVTAALLKHAAETIGRWE